jgi:SAM-dependent MidA family methyltransferase
MSQSQATSSDSALSLTDYLINRIRREGPITFHDWMQEALFNKTAGYYMRADARIWGRRGDYRTSPETSELFSATFARYSAGLFEELAKPTSFHFVECGAGDGSFAEGMLTALRDCFPAMYAATTYYIDEINFNQRRILRERLAQFTNKLQFGSLNSLPRLNSGIIFSNELLDAFPVHRITKQNGQLSEFYVALNDRNEFEWTTGRLSSERLREIYRANGIEIDNDQIIELCPQVDDWFAVVAEKLLRGYVVTVDYGFEAADLYDATRRPTGTLRAYARHNFAEVLQQPGERDVTAHVNWTRIRTVGSKLGLETVAFKRQDQFLLDAGILSELIRKTGSGISDADAARLSVGAREMFFPDGMGPNFQVLVQKKTL